MWGLLKVPKVESIQIFSSLIIGYKYQYHNVKKRLIHYQYQTVNMDEPMHK